MKMNKGIALIYLILMLLISILAFLYLTTVYNIVYSGVVVLTFVLFVLFITQLQRSMVLIYEIDSEHPSVYWVIDQFKLLIKNPFSKNKRLRNNLLWLRIIFLMFIICIGILVNF